MLFVLIGLLCTITATNTYAQRVPRGGGGGRGYSSPHYSPPQRVSVPVSRGYYHGYHGYRGPVYGGGVYYRHGWYGPGYRRYYNPFFPPIGFYVSTLPVGYFALGPQFGPVYYYGGTYYESSNDNRGYRVVDPPLNATVPDLPDGATEVQVDGNSYYELNGTYYQEVMTDNGRRYQVVGKNGKIGNREVTPQDQNNENNSSNDDNAPADILNDLPQGSRSIQINGQQYYLSPDGMYYQKVDIRNGTGYKVVGKMEADQ